MNGGLGDAARRAVLGIARGIIRAVGDGTPLQTTRVSLLADEEKDGVERVQEYGFTSVPLPRSDAVLVFVGGNRDHGVIVATDSREHRPGGMRPGDVTLYDHRGNLITLTEDGIEIISPEHVKITAPTIKIVGDVSIEGNLAVDGIDFKTHAHPENDEGGPTDPPQAG